MSSMPSTRRAWPRWLRQILRDRGISFQRTRTWKESREADKEAKLDRIEYVTSHFPDRCFAFDQFGPLSIWSASVIATWDADGSRSGVLYEQPSLLGVR
jgi:hypothetical protein